MGTPNNSSLRDPTSTHTSKMMVLRALTAALLLVVVQANVREHVATDTADAVFQCVAQLDGNTQSITKEAIQQTLLALGVHPETADVTAATAHNNYDLDADGVLVQSELLSAPRATTVQSEDDAREGVAVGDPHPDCSDRAEIGRYADCPCLCADLCADPNLGAGAFLNQCDGWAGSCLCPNVPVGRYADCPRLCTDLCERGVDT